MTIDISALQELPEIESAPVGLKPKTCKKTECDSPTCNYTVTL